MLMFAIVCWKYGIVVFQLVAPRAFTEEHSLTWNRHLQVCIQVPEETMMALGAGI
jgi:hypothetical protein